MNALFRHRMILVATVLVAVAGTAAMVVTRYAASAATSVSGQITGMDGTCLGAAGGSTTNGTRADIYPCVGSETQRWTFPGDGTIRTAGKCLDVAGAGTRDGTAAQLYDCNDTVAQQWVYTSGHDLVNPNADKCLDLTGNTSADFTPAQIWTCTGGRNQKWTVPAGEAPSTGPPSGPSAGASAGTSASASAGTSASASAGPSASGAPGSFWGDTSGIPAAQNVLTLKVLNKTNGRYPDSQVYWTFNGQTHSIAQQQYVDVPVVSAARMYFYLGSPNGQYSDFIEFNTTATWIGVNTTRVDGFGLKLALRLRTRDGAESTVGEDSATFAEDRTATFQRFSDEVPAEFKGLAQIQAPYRIPAPANSGDFQPGGRYADYFTGYASSLGYNVSTRDVFACAGTTLQNNAALCGALNRHVAHLDRSQWSDTARYYQSSPANYYAKFWHDHGIDRKAYGFPYDDAADQSTYISANNPQYLLVAVGW